VALAGAIVGLARRSGLDVLHVHYGVPHAASAVLARQALGAGGPAIVATLHGSDVVTFGTDEAIAAVTGACLRSLDAVTTPSSFLAGRARVAYGVLPEVVPNFVDTTCFRADAARPALLEGVFGPERATATLVHVSNFRPVKAVRALVPVLARLAPRGVRLVIVGDGPERAAVEADARAAGVRASVAFVAPPPDADTLAAWVAACDVFVLPSELESFGLAALEALACGLPVVARRVGGIPEVVHDGATGRLAGDDAELAELVERLVAAPEERRAMGAAAAADARRRFSPDAIVARWSNVYAAALSGGVHARVG
jgi:N-acetyl-alpha-D-glucosaminyl L-malate synthase BshA